MRKFFVAVVLMLAVVFLLARKAELSSISEIVQQANPIYLFVAVILLIFFLFSTVMLYRSIFRSLDLDEKPARMSVLVASAFFVNIVTPSAGMGGIAIFISEARRKGVSSARVMVANALIVLLEYLGFLAVLSLGLIVLLRRSMLKEHELIATSLIVCFVSVLGSFLYTGMRSSEALGNTLARLARTVNHLLWPIIHRNYFDPQLAHHFAQDAASGLYDLRQNPTNLIVPGLLALFDKILLLTIFLCCFLAYNVPFSPGTIIAGWSLAYLFLTVSPTPGGIGIVEGVLPLTLTSLYVPLGAATLITITYRAITLWLPLLLGMLAFNWIAHYEKTTTVVQNF